MAYLGLGLGAVFGLRSGHGQVVALLCVIVQEVAQIYCVFCAWGAFCCIITVHGFALLAIMNTVYLRSLCLICSFGTYLADAGNQPTKLFT